VVAAVVRVRGVLEVRAPQHVLRDAGPRSGEALVFRQDRAHSGWYGRRLGSGFQIKPHEVCRHLTHRDAIRVRKALPNKVGEQETPLF
jgi:hypothetical protein